MSTLQPLFLRGFALFLTIWYVFKTNMVLAVCFFNITALMMMAEEGIPNSAIGVLKKVICFIQQRSSLIPYGHKQ